MRRFPILRWLPLAAVWLSLGCATTEVYEAEQAPEYVVTKEFASFYQDGPLQTRGPDLGLRINDRVKLLKKDFTGFAMVEISDGRRGYVGVEDLAPAPPRPPTPVDPPPSSGSNRRKSGFESVYAGPQVNDVPLPDASRPLPDLNVGPEEIPTGSSMIDSEPTDQKPKFRY